MTHFHSETLRFAQGSGMSMRVFFCVCFSREAVGAGVVRSCEAHPPWPEPQVIKQDWEGRKGGWEAGREEGKKGGRSPASMCSAPLSTSGTCMCVSFALMALVTHKRFQGSLHRQGLCSKGVSPSGAKSEVAKGSGHFLRPGFGEFPPFSGQLISSL